MMGLSSKGDYLTMSNDTIRSLNPRMCLLVTMALWSALAIPMSLGQAVPPPVSAPSSAANAPFATTMTFEVATVRVSAPMSADQAMRTRAVGRLGAHLDGLRAQYTYMTLKTLVVYAYKLRPDQVSGPDWMASDHFDIVARLPEGATKDDAPKMLQALLADRFKLAVHYEMQERPVLALVVAKGGPKLKDSPALPAIDEDAELKPGEQKVDLPDGPARMSRALDAPKNLQGTMRFDMGTRGVFVQGIDEQAQTAVIDGKGVTMGGFADMLTQVMQISGAGSRPVVDQTGLTGHYEVVLNLSMADLMAVAGRAMGVTASPPDSGAAEASDPSGGGGTSVFASVAKLGLKLEPSKAMVKILVVDSVEKTPTEN
jgi:uncharacterized protein (TIGR03435 family)